MTDWLTEIQIWISPVWLVDWPTGQKGNMPKSCVEKLEVSKLIVLDRCVVIDEKWLHLRQKKHRRLNQEQAQRHDPSFHNRSKVVGSDQLTSGQVSWLFVLESEDLHEAEAAIAAWRHEEQFSAKKGLSYVSPKVLSSNLTEAIWLVHFLEFTHWHSKLAGESSGCFTHAEDDWCCSTASVKFPAGVTSWISSTRPFNEIGVTHWISNIAFANFTFASDTTAFGIVRLPNWQWFCDAWLAASSVDAVMHWLMLV